MHPLIGKRKQSVWREGDLVGTVDDQTTQQIGIDLVHRRRNTGPGSPINRHQADLADPLDVHQPTRRSQMLGHMPCRLERRVEKLAINLDHDRKVLVALTAPIKTRQTIGVLAKIDDDDAHSSASISCYIKATLKTAQRAADHTIITLILRKSVVATRQCDPPATDVSPSWTIRQPDQLCAGLVAPRDTMLVVRPQPKVFCGACHSTDLV